MKTILILSVCALCASLCSCSFKTGEPLPVKFSVFSTEYGASATYSKDDGLTMGFDADRIKDAIVDRNGK